MSVEYPIFKWKLNKDIVDCAVRNVIKVADGSVKVFSFKVLGEKFLQEETSYRLVYFSIIVNLVYFSIIVKNYTFR